MRTVMVSVTRVPPHDENLRLTFPEYRPLVEPVSLTLNRKYLLLAEGVEALKVPGSRAFTRIRQSFKRQLGWKVQATIDTTPTAGPVLPAGAFLSVICT